MAEKTKRLERTYGGGKSHFRHIASGAEFSIDIEELCPGIREAVKDVKNIALFINQDGESRDISSMALNNAFGDLVADPSKDFAAVMAARKTAMLNGEWSSKGAGGGGSSRTTIFLMALARYGGGTVDEARVHFEKLSETKQKKLKEEPAIKNVEKTIRSERAAEAAKASDAAFAKSDSEALVVNFGS